MNRNWDKYIKENKSCGDCQLVTTVNAYYYLTGKIITEKRYEKFVKQTGAHTGSCIGIGKIWKQLDIEEKKTYNSLIDIPYPYQFPLEAIVWHRKYGRHSILIVDYEPKSFCFRITNFQHETSSYGWMFEEEIYKFIVNAPLKKWKFRLLGLIKK